MEPVKADARTINALFTALGATITALAETMPPPHKKAFAVNLARMAKNAEANGDALLETMLIDLFRAASI